MGKYIHVFVLFVTSIMISVNLAHAQCGFTDTLEVPDFSSEQIYLEITGANNNDLSTNGVCAINIEFEHATVGDLIVELTSPTGHTITLIGPSGAFGSTEFTNWDISFVPCNQQADPDVGYEAQWNNDQFWGAFGNYDGSYYPYDGCLEDFNTGPVNGVWTLNVIDNQQFDVGRILDFELLFCDPAGIDCGECLPPIVDVIDNDFTACIGGEILDFAPNLDITYPDSTQMNFTSFYLISSMDSIYEHDTIVDMTNYEAGNYTICAVQAKENDLPYFESFLDTASLSVVRNELESETPAFCASISMDCMDIEIRPQPDSVTVNKVLCAGESIIFRGNQYTQEGTYIQTVHPLDGCDTTFILQIEKITVESSIIPPDEINCYSPEIILDGSGSVYSSQSSIKWFTDTGNIVGPNTTDSIQVNEDGRYYLAIEEMGCRDTTSVFVNSDLTIPNITVADGTINCRNRTIRLDAQTTSPYDSVRWTGPNGFTSDVLRPVVDKNGNYQLRITGTNGCVNTAAVNIGIDTIKPIATAIEPDARCKKDTIELAIEESRNSEYTYQWTSNNGFFAQAKDTFAQAEGSYIIKVTNTTNGCTASDTIVVDDLMELPVINMSADTLDCYVGSVVIDMRANADTFNYQWTGPGGFSSTVQSPAVTLPGTYYVLVQTGNGCGIMDSIEVYGDFFVPDLSVRTDTLHCESDTIQLRASSSETVTYEWTGPFSYEAQGQIADVVLPGEYTVLITTSGGCTNSETVEVIEDYEDVGVTLFSDTLSCAEPIAEVSYTSSAVDSFYWFTVKEEYITDSIITVDRGGIQYFHYKDTSGCRSARAIRTVVDSVPPMNTYDIPKFGCSQDSIQLQIATTDGIDFHWSGPAGYNSDREDPYVYSVGEYFLEAMGTNGCILYDTINVVYDTVSPPVKVNGLDLGCRRDTIELSVDKTADINDYQWSGPQGFTSIKKNPTVSLPGKYTVTVTASNGCVGNGFIDIDYDTIPPVLQVEGDTLQCDKPTVTLTASANVDDVDFSWYLNDMLKGSDSLLTTGDAGTYTVVAERRNTCTDTVKYDLTSDQNIPDFSVILDTLDCNVSSFSPIVIMDTSEVASFSWTGPGSFNSAEMEPTLNRTGSYKFEFTLENGCVGGNNYTVAEDLKKPNDNLATSYVLDCDEPSLVLDSELSGIKYETIWESNGDTLSTEPILKVMEPGVYNFTATGKNGCILSTSIPISIDTIQPHLSVTVDTIDCKVTKVRASVNADSDTYTYRWSGPDTFSSDIKEPFFNRPGFYTVEVKDTNGCTFSKTFPVIADTLEPVINIEGGSLSCDDSTFQLKLGSASIIEDVRWFGPNNFFTEEREPVVDQTGEYNVTVIAPNGCFSRDTLVVDDDPSFPDIQVDAYPLDCYLDSVRVRLIPQAGRDYIYAWSAGSVQISEDRVVNLDGSGEYTLTVTDTFNGCSIDTLISFNKDSLLPQSEIIQQAPILCDKSTTTLVVADTSASYLQYKWESLGDGIINSPPDLPIVDIEGVGTYILSVTDTRNGCVFTDTIEIDTIQSGLEHLSLNLSEKTCKKLRDGKVEVVEVVGGKPPYQFALDNEVFGDIQRFTNLDSGKHTLKVRDAYGCIIDTTISLSRTTYPRVELSPDTTIALGEIIRFDPVMNIDTSLITVQWVPSSVVNCAVCPFTSTTPTHTQVFTLTIEDSLGCRSSDNREITVIQEGGVYVPNIFTPNRDNTNEFFRPFFSDAIAEVKNFAIFDRWGNKVFGITDVSPSSTALKWDGTAHGKSLAPQVLMYKLSFRLKTGREFTKTGTVTLLK